MTLEEFVSELNALAFFKEFTFSKNTFKPGAGGTELELADNIVWMADDVTILQLKERSTEHVEDDASETRWFQAKVLGKATKQVRDTLKFLEEHPAITVTNGHGHSFDLRGDQILTKTKIVVFLPGKIVPDIAKSTRHHVSQTGGFIHVIDARDYLEICRTLRVPADIRDYFGYRQRLLESDAKFAAPEALIMGQYLSGDENTLPSEESHKFLLALKQNASEFDISMILQNIYRKVERQNKPDDYYEILRQFGRLPRSGWKAAKTRINYCIDALQKQEFRAPTRFAWKELSVGFVFVPVDPKLMAEENAVELMERGLLNFTLGHKYDQHLNCCVGLIMAKDGEDFLLNWCVITQPWEYDAELEAKLKENFPFLKVKEELIPRFEFR
ncbi:hypothetical protein FLL57_07030 [Rhodopseudomonas palustris]|uniref:hypothetical protein n=1 Tax=Rhodopseudomonas palustris TaxID=1076 RepID=UPI00115C4B14|nr:hypothetical protein [Rhodopseudomonas palustris]QDL97073.1 hypothetical protein FLL57_07030 [Rhodopseudomonas palustris]